MKTPVMLRLRQGALHNIQELCAAHLIAAHGHAMMPADVPIIRDLVISVRLAPPAIECRTQSIIEAVKLIVNPLALFFSWLFDNGAQRKVSCPEFLIWE